MRGTGEKEKGARGFRRLRHLRWRLRPAELVTLVFILSLFSVGLGAALPLSPFPFAPVPPEQSRVERANAIVTAWNDMAASMATENKMLEELQQNLKDNPPHLVFDPRRGDLYALAIAEHRRQLADIEKMQEADR